MHSRIYRSILPTRNKSIIFIFPLRHSLWLCKNIIRGHRCIIRNAIPIWMFEAWRREAEKTYKNIKFIFQSALKLSSSYWKQERAE